MFIKDILVFIALIFPLLSYAQDDGNKDDLSKDSLQNTASESVSFVKRWGVPVSLMAYGTLEAVMMSKTRMLNYAVGHEVIRHKPVRFRIDDYTQYVPAASVYVLNLAGVRGRHRFKDRTMILGLAGLFTAISVNGFKYTVRERRPDGSRRNSSPPGHTAVAFMGAEFLRQEYKDVSPWYGIGGYVVAMGTGALRVYNNKHWAGDVIFGAGLGILCTKLSYCIYPVMQCKLMKKKTERKNTTDLAFYPYYNGQQGGLSIVVQF